MFQNKDFPIHPPLCHGSVPSPLSFRWSVCSFCFLSANTSVSWVAYHRIAIGLEEAAGLTGTCWDILGLFSQANNANNETKGGSEERLHRGELHHQWWQIQLLYIYIYTVYTYTYAYAYKCTYNLYNIYSIYITCSHVNKTTEMNIHRSQRLGIQLWFEAGIQIKWTWIWHPVHTDFLNQWTVVRENPQEPHRNYSIFSSNPDAFYIFFNHFNQSNVAGIPHSNNFVPAPPWSHPLHGAVQPGEAAFFG